MRAVAETEIFTRYAAEVWSESERVEFINYIAANPEAGDIIRGSGAVARFVGSGLEPGRVAARE